MATGVFVTGTDTGVGKTVAAVALLRSLAAAGVRAIGMKPVSAGVDARSGINEDVAALRRASTLDAPLDDRNPYRFDAPVAPHLAARRECRPIDLTTIVAAYRRLAAHAEAIVVEGAGGVLVPLDDRLDMLDIARALRLPALLVVGVRLGCLHQARAATLAIRMRGVALGGWIASRIDPDMPLGDENVAWLARQLGTPLVADIADPDRVAVGPGALAALGLLAGR